MSKSHFRSFSLKKRFARKNSLFLPFFDSFSLLFPFVCPKVNCSRSRRSYLWHFFLKSNGSNLLTVALNKRATGADCSWKRENRCFTIFCPQKLAIRMKNQKKEFPTLIFSFLHLFSYLTRLQGRCISRLWARLITE